MLFWKVKASDSENLDVQPFTSPLHEDVHITCYYAYN